MKPKKAIKPVKAWAVVDRRGALWDILHNGFDGETFVYSVHSTRQEAVRMTHVEQLVEAKIIRVLISPLK